MESKFYFGDRVFLKDIGVGRVTNIVARTNNMTENIYYRYEVTFDSGHLVDWFDENELELYVEKSCETPNKPYYDVQRNVTVEEVEKLEEELRRKNSELRDLKELIIKLLFDRYGF